MTNNSRPVGRPLGKVSTEVLELLKQQPGMSSREIAYELQASVSHIKNICYRLVLQRRIRVIARERVKGSKKPVAKYAIVQPLKPFKPLIAGKSNVIRF